MTLVLLYLSLQGPGRVPIQKPRYLRGLIWQRVCGLELKCTETSPSLLLSLWRGLCGYKPVHSYKINRHMFTLRRRGGGCDAVKETSVMDQRSIDS